MKVRWTRGSLRLRITPTELESLRLGKVTWEELSLPGGCVWRVEIQVSPAETSLMSKGITACLRLSEDDRDRLIVPQTEGVYFQSDTGFRYFVEKDFPCVHPRGAETLEPATETFTAPAGFSMRKEEE